MKVTKLSKIFPKMQKKCIILCTYLCKVCLHTGSQSSGLLLHSFVDRTFLSEEYLLLSLQWLMMRHKTILQHLMHLVSKSLHKYCHIAVCPAPATALIVPSFSSPIITSLSAPTTIIAI
jgi:hypothetical protein